MFRNEPVVTKLPPLPELRAKNEPSADKHFDYEVSMLAGAPISHRAVLEDLHVTRGTDGSNVTLMFIAELSKERYANGTIEAFYDNSGTMLYSENIKLDRHTLINGPHPLFADVKALVVIGA